MKRLGVYYKETVLSLPEEELVEVTLPRKQDYDDPVRVEKQLFGYRLHANKGHIDLDTEEQARFCKVFSEAGLMTVMMPKDNEYLKKILPGLEELKRKHDRILNEELEGLISRKNKRQVFYIVWSEVMWKEPKPASRRACGDGRRD